MTKRIWAGLLALGMALTALPFGIYAEETAWEEAVPPKPKAPMPMQKKVPLS